MTFLYSIATPPTDRKPFVAGFTLNYENGVVVEAAPILRRDIMGRRLVEVHSMCLRRGWTLERVET